MGERTRRGLTLVEVVVIVSVVGVTASLLLPAIRAAQIFSRRVKCTDNLKQVGLACHNYNSANGTLPMSRVEGPGHGNGHSAFTALLPYMEHAPVYNAYNFSLENWHAANATVTRTKMAVFLCPENKGEADMLEAKDVPTLDGKGLPGKNKFARVHYGVNWGGGHEGTGDDFLKAKGKYLGLMMTVITPEGKQAGAKNVSFSDVTDGLSFTLMAVEKRDGSGWTQGGWAGSEFDVNTTPAYDGDDPKAAKAFTGSYHSSGPNALLGDGSVRVISPKIEKDVWYALMTRAGGEPIRPDQLKP
jgi:Tfp pilus assembly protein PilE